MSDIKYTVIEGADTKNVVAFIDGEMYQANDQNPAWADILKALEDGADNAAALFSPAQVVSKNFQKVTDRVSLRGSQVFFDGVAQAGVLVDSILRHLQEGNDFTPLVNFMEKVANNPNEHSREQLYRWLTATGGFSIAEDGDIVGYKGVQAEYDGSLRSSHSGHAIVDGVEYNNARIPNNPGSVVEMPRDEVQHDPSRGCHTGLHVGTWSYARSFAPVTLEVRVNPRDVVSVPTDCGDAKMRTCRYVVVDKVDAPYDTALVKEPVVEPEAKPAEVVGTSGVNREPGTKAIVTGDTDEWDHSFESGTVVTVLENTDFDYDGSLYVTDGEDNEYVGSNDLSDVAEEKAKEPAPRAQQFVYTPNSTVLSSLEYLNTGAGVVCAVFRNGSKVHYRDVSREVYNEWVAADSVGEFLNTQIKGKYPENSHLGL